LRCSEIGISAIGTVAPDIMLTQEEVFSLLGLNPHYSLLFRRTGVAKRHFAIEPRIALHAPAQKLHEEYYRAALDLSQKAVIVCLEGASLHPRDIDALVYVSCTGFSCPPIGSHLAAHIPFRSDIWHYPLIGIGCGAAGTGLRVAYNHVVSRPGSRVLVCCTEICSATAFHPPVEKGDILGEAIFADGAACALVQEGGSLVFQDFEVRQEAALAQWLGFTWRHGRLKLVMSTDVPEKVGPMLPQVVEPLLERAGLHQDGVPKWAIHAGGSSIIRVAQEKLGLDDIQVAECWDVWREQGNMSSPTILWILKRILERNRLHGQPLVFLSMGAGVEVHAIRFSVNGGLNE